MTGRKHVKMSFKYNMSDNMKNLIHMYVKNKAESNQLIALLELEVAMQVYTHKIEKGMQEVTETIEKGVSNASIK